MVTADLLKIFKLKILIVTKCLQIKKSPSFRKDFLENISAEIYSTASSHSWQIPAEFSFRYFQHLAHFSPSALVTQTV